MFFQYCRQETAGTDGLKVKYSSRTSITEVEQVYASDTRTSFSRINEIM